MYTPSQRILRVTLCNPNVEDEVLELDFRIFDTPIAMRWADVVASLTKDSIRINDPERFYNFPNDPKGTDDWIRTELKTCIDGINDISPGYVDVDLGPSTDLTQETMNTLHEYFVNGCEDLRTSAAFLAFREQGTRLGDVKALCDDASLWRRICGEIRDHANLDAESLTYPELLASIQDHPRVRDIVIDIRRLLVPAEDFLVRLNLAIHRWEDKRTIEKLESSGREGWKYHVHTFEPYRPIPMEDSDLRHFTIQDVFGRVYIEDALAGKCIWDVYRDGDTLMDGDHFKTLAYYWGNYRVYFGPSHTAEECEHRIADFWRWFDEHEESLERAGVRRDDPRMMSIGSVPVADLERCDSIHGLSRHEVVDRISLHQRVRAVAILEDVPPPEDVTP